VFFLLTNTYLQNLTQRFGKKKSSFPRDPSAGTTKKKKATVKNRAPFGFLMLWKRGWSVRALAQVAFDPRDPPGQRNPLCADALCFFLLRVEKNALLVPHRGKSAFQALKQRARAGLLVCRLLWFHRIQWLSSTLKRKKGKRMRRSDRGFWG